MTTVLALWLSLAVAGPARAPTDTQLAALSERVHEMQAGLSGLEQADGADARQRVEQHWLMVNYYMAALALALPHAATAPPRDGAPDCRVTRGKWTPLPLPVDVDVFRYRSAMTATLQRMRAELAKLRKVHGASDRLARAHTHWSGAYRDLQELRGLGWLFDRWVPAGDAPAWLPEPDSAGAQHAALYCSQCHAAPPPSLHTAAEWGARVARMQQHMARADTPFPVCVTVPSDADLELLRAYLERNAR